MQRIECFSKITEKRPKNLSLATFFRGLICYQHVGAQSASGKILYKFQNLSLFKCSKLATEKKNILKYNMLKCMSPS